jgi:hypothetical protein
MVFSKANTIQPLNLLQLGKENRLPVAMFSASGDKSDQMLTKTPSASHAL